MKFYWLGHACFLIVLASGKKIVTDPFDRKLGYPEPALSADIVTVSHQHFDHNAVEMISGKPVVISEAGRHEAGGLLITGISSYHDPVRGSQRGKNIIFVIETEGLRICHLGDLGHVLEKSQLEKVGTVDVLMIPVGGFYTIGAAEAVKVVNQLNPKYVVPMHYKTGYIDFPISTADEFLKYYPGSRVEKELEVAEKTLPGTTTAVLIELKED